MREERPLHYSVADEPTTGQEKSRTARLSKVNMTAKKKAYGVPKKVKTGEEGSALEGKNRRKNTRVYVLYRTGDRQDGSVLDGLD